MSRLIDRNYLEINSVADLKESNFVSNDYFLTLVNPCNFQLNKFFYKNIGKKHHWKDRLVWSDEKWISYVSDNNLNTYILKYKEDLAGYFELLIHKNSRDVEIAYLGLLEEYQNKKLGSYLLSKAIKEAFFNRTKRVWVHTCSLDHRNALNNYLSRGMKIFKKETISINI
ncbi:GNAT family N-acetyltransferase [Pelagibacterales bacterium SAG-MED39]|nr:GNAT family N-acetyltransferase [Pelagibacterales bacterium SAG-MED39]